VEFERVGGVFYRAASLDEVPAVVGRLAREREARGLVTWHAAALGADLASALEARGLDVHEMPAGETAGAAERERLRAITAGADVGLTGVDLAVAETGTLILVSGAGRPRSTSLLPPCHIAVFDRTALVESLRQVGVVLESWHRDGAPPATGALINFITGPSRTADIELTLTRGVHGPKEVHAIFVEQGIRG
jgi:L-lactate dehydrogenase complex protein LldG